MINNYDPSEIMAATRVCEDEISSPWDRFTGILSYVMVKSTSADIYAKRHVGSPTTALAQTQKQLNWRSIRTWMALVATLDYVEPAKAEEFVFAASACVQAMRNGRDPGNELRILQELFLDEQRIQGNELTKAVAKSIEKVRPLRDLLKADVPGQMLIAEVGHGEA